MQPPLSVRSQRGRPSIWEPILYTGIVVGLAYISFRIAAQIANHPTPHDLALSGACAVGAGTMLILGSLAIGLNMTIIDSRPPEERVADPDLPEEPESDVLPGQYFFTIPTSRSTGEFLHATGDQVKAVVRLIHRGESSLEVGPVKRALYPQDLENLPARNAPARVGLPTE